MIYGVKVIHTHSIGEDDKRFYEELVLKVDAESFDEAYKKAEDYMKDSIYEYTNINNEIIKTLSVEAVDCFLALEPEGDVQDYIRHFQLITAAYLKKNITLFSPLLAQKMSFVN